MLPPERLGTEEECSGKSGDQTHDSGTQGGFHEQLQPDVEYLLVEIAVGFSDAVCSYAQFSVKRAVLQFPILVDCRESLANASPGRRRAAQILSATQESLNGEEVI